MSTLTLAFVIEKLKWGGGRRMERCAQAGRVPRPAWCPVRKCRYARSEQAFYRRRLPMFRTRRRLERLEQRVAADEEAIAKLKQRLEALEKGHVGLRSRVRKVEVDRGGG